VSTYKTRHKPSTKHTLDEVLRTLQDLVRNELSEVPPATSAPPAQLAEDSLADAGELPPLEAFESLLEAELSPETTPVPESVIDIEVHEELERLEPEPFLNEAIGTMSTDEPEPPVLTDVVVPAPSDTSAERTWRAPEQTSINWDDIPVLNDVVEPDGMVQITHEQVRTVAIQSVARLNIELRKAGQVPLEAAMIDRLEAALREALLALPSERAANDANRRR